MKLVTMKLLATFMLFAMVGCNWIDGARKDTKPPASTGKLEPKPAKEFVSFLNRQSGYVSSVRYDSVSLSSSVPGQFVPRLPSGMLVCSKPRNFRMQAGLALGGDQLDVGSNPNEFWMFVKQSDPKYLFCSHSDFPKVQEKLPVPFETDWVLEALGMITYPENRPYRIEISERDHAYYLSWEDTIASGQRVRKVVEFAGDRATTTSPQVRRHLILTPTKAGVGTGWEIAASAEIKQVQTKEVGFDPKTKQTVYVQVPTQVLLEWPIQKVKMDLTLGRVKLNEPMTPEEVTNLFEKPARLDNANPVNLADLRFSAGPATGRDLPPPITERPRR